MSCRVGIAGYGLAGAVFHAPLVAATDGLEVAAIMTRAPERVSAAREEHPYARVVDSLEELLDGIDVLVVATPNRSHVPIGLAGLERDLCVVVDKPMAATAAEARQLVAAGGRLTVFQNRRWDDDFLTLARVLAAGELGDLVRFESRYERYRPDVRSQAWREAGDPADGGGQLLDLGPHVVDQAVRLLGRPTAVYAEIATRRPGAVVDDDAFLALEHPGGIHSHLWISAAAALEGPRFRVSGLRAGFATDGVDPQEDQLQAGLRPGDPAYGAGRTGVLAGEEIPLERGRYEAFYAGVREWASGSAPAPVDPADSLAVLEILEAARRSSERGQVVRVEEQT